jgi:hypothetical protein
MDINLTDAPIQHTATIGLTPVWQPTAALRWRQVDTLSGPEFDLQQMWVEQISGDTDWRNVPKEFD